LSAVWPTSVVFARVLPSALFVARRAAFFTMTTALGTTTIPIAVAAFWAFPITMRETLAVVSVPPAAVPVPVSFPVPVSTITSVAVLARRAVTVRITVMMVRAVCKRGRRKEVSTVQERCLLVEGAPVDW
jgi:hypothetical protein